METVHDISAHRGTGSDEHKRGLHDFREELEEGELVYLTLIASILSH